MSYLLFIVSIFVFGYALVQYRVYRSLQQFKGPWSTGWSRLWLLFAHGVGSMHVWFKSINDRYGTYQFSLTFQSWVMNREVGLINHRNHGTYWSQAPSDCRCFPHSSYELGSESIQSERLLSSFAYSSNPRQHSLDSG